MVDLSAFYSNLKQPEYFYRVNQYVTTFGRDAGRTEPFDVSDDFKGNDLKHQRELAVKFYQEKLQGLHNGSYFLPFASPDEFVSGKNAAFSVDLIFVQYYNEDRYDEYYLSDSDEIDTQEALEFEKTIWQELGIYQEADEN